MSVRLRLNNYFIKQLLIHQLDMLSRSQPILFVLSTANSALPSNTWTLVRKWVNGLKSFKLISLIIIHHKHLSNTYVSPFICQNADAAWLLRFFVSALSYNLINWILLLVSNNISMICGIRGNPKSRNPESGIQNPESGIHNPELRMMIEKFTLAMSNI